MTCCFWDGCNGDASKATRTKEEYEKFLLEKNLKLEKFNSDTALDKAQKENAFSDKVLATAHPTTMLAIVGTEKQGIELRPVEFVTVGGRPYNKFSSFQGDDDEAENSLWNEKDAIIYNG